jgi:hypothetical protein
VWISGIPAHAPGLGEIMNSDPRTTETLDRRIRAACEAMAARAGGLLRVTEGPARSVAGIWDRHASLAVRLPNLAAIICLLVVSGCAGNAPQPETRSEPMRSGAAPGSDSQMCHIDRALLVPVRAPDCGFGRSDLKTLDPEQWAHLKIEFEKKCYQHAEKMVRDRLRQLQVASRCGIEQASR